MKNQKLKKYLMKNEELEKIIQLIPKGNIIPIEYKNSNASIKVNIIKNHGGVPTNKYDLVFTNITFESSFRLFNINLPILSLTFLNCEFKEDLIIDSSSIKELFICQNNIIKGQLNIWNNSKINLLWINQYFNINSFSIHNKSVIRKLNIHRCGKFNKIGKIKDFSISESDFTGEFNISTTNINNLNIQKSTFNCRVRISKEKEYYTDNFNQIDRFYFSNNILDNSLRIGHSSFKEFNIENLKINSNSEINLGEIIIKENGIFKIVNLRNWGKFKIYKLNEMPVLGPDYDKINTILPSINVNYGVSSNDGKLHLAEKFNINNSSLGYIEFQNINFMSFKKVILFDNTIKELYSVGNRWMEEIFYEAEEPKKMRNPFDELYDLKESYRIFKIELFKQKDIPQALFFFSKEMEEYGKGLKNERINIANWRQIHNSKILNKWIKIYTYLTYKFIDRFILWFNKNTNNFGLDWFKPLFLIIITNSIFYLIFSLSNFQVTNFSWNNFFINLGFFSQFFIPINTIEKIFGNYENINRGWEFINLIKNILIGVFLYQGIQAFRKYSRKI